MNFKKTMFALAVGSVGIMGAMSSAHAFTLNNGDVLTINSGSFPNLYNSGTLTGSYFVMDLNGNSIANNSEIILLSQGTTGITIGATGGAGNYHEGLPVAADADSGAIVDSWLFNKNTGTNYTTVGITGSTEAGLNMSGWGVSWSTTAAIPMGGGSWVPVDAAGVGGGLIGLPTTGFSNGTALFEWDGVYGNAYSLFYTATVPAGDASGFGGTQYALRLTGTVVQAVPEASTYGMMLAGLGLVGFAVRRRKLMA